MRRVPPGRRVRRPYVMIVSSGRGFTPHSVLAQRSSVIDSSTVGRRRPLRGARGRHVRDRSGEVARDADVGVATGPATFGRGRGPPVASGARSTAGSDRGVGEAALHRRGRARRAISLSAATATGMSPGVACCGRSWGATSAPSRPGLRFSYACVCGDPRCRPERRKPALAPEWGGAAIRFNLSHADDLAVYAVARDREIGIDLECLRSDIDYAELATYSLSTDEAAAVRSLPQARQPAAFLAMWTRKEAYLKGQGVGLMSAPESWRGQWPRDAAAGSGECDDELIGPRGACARCRSSLATWRPWRLMGRSNESPAGMWRDE